MRYQSKSIPWLLVLRLEVSLIQRFCYAVNSGESVVVSIFIDQMDAWLLCWILLSTIDQIWLKCGLKLNCSHGSFIGDEVYCDLHFITSSKKVFTSLLFCSKRLPNGQVRKWFQLFKFSAAAIKSRSIHLYIMDLELRWLKHFSDKPKFLSLRLDYCLGEPGWCLYIIDVTVVCLHEYDWLTMVLVIDDRCLENFGLQ